MTASDRDVIYNRLTNVMIRDEDIYSDDQVAPGRVGSSAAEGGASAGGGFGVGLGVVDSRLPPHTKPPTHHMTVDHVVDRRRGRSFYT